MRHRKPLAHDLERRNHSVAMILGGLIAWLFVGSTILTLLGLS